MHIREFQIQCSDLHQEKRAEKVTPKDFLASLFKFVSYKTLQ